MKHLFKNKLSDGDDRMVNFFTLGVLGWFPFSIGNVLVKEWGLIFFGIIYACITALLYLIIRIRMASKPKNNPVTPIKIICISVVILHTFFMIFAYSYKLLAPKSLWITLPLSLFIAIFCVEAWIHKSNEKKETPSINDK